MRPVRLLLFIPLLLAISLTFPAAEAAVIGISSSDVNSIDWNGLATYKVLVQNTDDKPHTLRLRAASLAWGDVIFDQNIVYLGPGASQTVNVKVSPPRDVRIGIYDLQMIAIDEQDTTIRGIGFLRLIINSELPHIEANFITGSAIDPGPTDIDLIVKNTGALSQVSLTGAFITPFSESRSFDIGYLDIDDAKLLWQGILDIPYNTKPNVYPFTFVIYQDGIEVDRTVKYVNIKEKETVQIDDKVSNSFLQEKHELTLTNVGNLDADNSYKVQMSTFDRIFTTSRSSSTTNSLSVGKEVVWNYNLAQGESMEIKYMVSYLPILEIALSMVLLLYVLAWYYKQDVSIIKEIEAHGDSLKVKVTAKGTSRSMLKSVVVEDYVPTPMKLGDKFSPVHPKVIKREQGKVKLIWRLDNLYPGDERVFTYTMKSSLGLIGDVLLPAAKARTHVDGESKIFYSNKVAMKGKVKVSEIEEEKPNA